MSETLMTEATKTNEGETASQAGSTAPEAQVAGTEQPAQQQQASEAKAPEAKAEGDKAEGDAGDKPQGAPEKYEFKAPDGQTLDDAVIGQFSEVAKELNLSQDAAQKVLDKMGPALAARHAEQFEAAQKQWADNAKVDKEFGGEKLTENLAVAKKALDTFGSPELSKLLNESGLGNHPEIIRAFYRAGKAISEDGFVGGKPSAPARDTVAQRMYPNMNP